MYYLWINLSSSVDRRNFMESQFAKYSNTGDVNIRIEGVVKNRGIAGCTQAHINAIIKGNELCNNLGIKSFVVCEDNFEFVSKIDWIKLMSDAPSNWEVLQLQTSNPMHGSNDCKFVQYRRSHWGAKIYLVNGNSANRIVDYVINNNHLNRDADQVIFEGVNTYTLLKPIGLIRKFKSTIAPWHDRFTDKFQSKYRYDTLLDHKYWLKGDYVSNDSYSDNNKPTDSLLTGNASTDNASTDHLPSGDRPLDNLTAATLEE